MLDWFNASRKKPADVKPIAISMGEPAGIGVECLFKAWHQRDAANLSPFFVIADPAHLKWQAAQLGYLINLREIADAAQARDAFAEALPVFPMALKRQVEFGSPDPVNAPLVIESIKRAAEFAIANEASALVTLPIHKSTLYQSGFHFPGHTEFLADICNSTRSTVMMLEVPGLRVALGTVHLSLKEAIAKINTPLIVNHGMLVDKSLREMFGIQQPRLAIAALNPHAGEEGALGLEEIEIIQPAIDQLRQRGLKVEGPMPSDTMFHADARAKYDCAICLYHDQGLIPVKTLDFHGGVNITLGLPIVRTSPDHGTAFDIAGKNQASAASLIAALQRAAAIAELWAQNKSAAA